MREVSEMGLLNWEKNQGDLYNVDKYLGEDARKIELGSVQ